MPNLLLPVNPLGQIVTVNFLSTLAALTKETLVSQRISRPFSLHLILANFALNQNRTVKLYFFMSPDDSAPTTLPLTGSNILGELSHTIYVVGDDQIKALYQNFGSESGGQYLKVFADNTDSDPHTIDVQMFVELLPAKGI